MSPSVCILPPSRTIEEPVFPFTNTNRNSHYAITCIDTVTNYVERDGVSVPDPEGVIQVTYMLSSNNFDYNNREFTPPNRNGAAFLQSIMSIDDVNTVRVAISPSGFPARVVVTYSSGSGFVSAEPAVLRAIARGAMGLGVDWVRVTRLHDVDDDAPL